MLLGIPSDGYSRLTGRGFNDGRDPKDISQRWLIDL